MTNPLLLVLVGVAVPHAEPSRVKAAAAPAGKHFELHEQLERNGQVAHFETRLLRATYLLSGTFFFSSFMNYVLAKWIVHSPAGSEAFNAELGRMTLLSYPMIAIPSMLMMMAIFFYLWRTIHGLTGLRLEDIMAVHEQRDGK